MILSTMSTANLLLSTVGRRDNAYDRCALEAGTHEARNLETATGRQWKYVVGPSSARSGPLQSHNERLMMSGVPALSEDVVRMPGSRPPGLGGGSASFPRAATSRSTPFRVNATVCELRRRLASRLRRYHALDSTLRELQRILANYRFDSGLHFVGRASQGRLHIRIDTM
jgi:hypothetical protein